MKTKTYFVQWNEPAFGNRRFYEPCGARDLADRFAKFVAENGGTDVAISWLEHDA